MTLASSYRHIRRSLADEPVTYSIVLQLAIERHTSLLLARFKR